MKRTRTKFPPLSKQIQKKVSKPVKKKQELDGNAETMISTGSTLLDLAISGGRVRGGGIPVGVFVEIFGQEASGKTVLLCELAGAVQRKHGEVMFHDPEARLNKQFATLFALNTGKMLYANPNTVTDVFKAVRDWHPESPINIPDEKIVHGIFADSLAALSTELEMETSEGDKMGMRRAKEFSEQLRKTCRILAQNNYLMVCSNQVRENVGVSFGEKYKSPGGEAIKFYSSLRIKTNIVQKITTVVKIKGKEIKRVVGVEINAQVVKSSVWNPYHSAPITILFDYGIDDIRENLKFLKRYTGDTVFGINGRQYVSLDNAIQTIEEEGWEQELKNRVIDLWEGIERKFDSNRKTKIR